MLQSPNLTIYSCKYRIAGVSMASSGMPQAEEFLNEGWNILNSAIGTPIGQELGNTTKRRKSDTTTNALASTTTTTT